MKRNLHILMLTLVAVLTWTALPVIAQGSLSVQVLQLLTRDNTWSGKQSFQNLRVPIAALPGDTTARIYTDISGNLYFNGGLIAGAGGGVTPHNLLSTTHSDTLASTPVRGGIIVANSTPAWAQVTFAANSFVQSNGTDTIFSTSGANLTTIPAAQLTGTAAAINGVNITALNASNLTSGTVNVARLANITTTQIAAGAAIAYSQLALTGGIVNADINAAAAIAYSKLNLTGLVVNGDLANATLLFAKWASNGCTNLQVAQYNGAAWVCKTLVPSDLTGGGTVTSVALTTPAFLTVSGSPVTTTGTLAVTLATQTANTIFAGPTSGGVVAPTFRALVNADFPVTGVAASSYSKVTVNTAGLVTAGTSAVLTTDVTGILPVANGGTNNATATNNRTLVGDGATWQQRALPNCPTGVLNFTTATNLFACSTLRFPISLIPATCDVAPAATTNWSLPSTLFAAANCVTAGNTVRGVLDYAAASDLTAQWSMKLPSDWSSTIDINLYWFSSTTAGNVQWSISTACNAAGATGDPAFNAAQTVTSAAAGVTNQYTLANITTLTTTGCAADRMFYLKMERNAGAGADTMAGTARLANVELVLRRLVS